MSGFQGYRLMLQDNVDLKSLVRSRNRLPSVPFRQMAEAPAVLISAWVDITEPLTCVPNESKNVPFWYRSGIPSASAFGISWFAQQSDAETNENALTIGIPLTTIFPHKPIALGGQKLEGYVRLIAPNVMMSVRLYGKITIFQE